MSIFRFKIEMFMNEFGTSSMIVIAQKLNCELN